MAALNKMQVRQDQLESTTATINQMRKDRIFTDVVLTCGENEFPAHRVMLSGGSPYFRTMLASQMTEAITGRVTLNTLDPESIEIIIEYIYTGIVRDLNSENSENELVHSVLEASHMLQMQILFNYCVSILRSKLSADYFLDVWAIAFLYDHADLMSEVQEYLITNLSAACRSADFGRLTLDQLKQLIVHAMLGPTSMDVVVTSLLEWTRADEELRAPEMSGLMSMINFNAVSLQFIKHLLSAEPLVQKNQAVFNSLLAVSLQTDTSESITRGPNLVCFGEEGGKTVMSIYNIPFMLWLPSKVCPFTVSYDMSTAAFGSHVYFFGVRSAGAADSVIKYAPANQTFTTCSKLKCPVIASGVGVLNEQMYLIGGRNESRVTVRTVQRFNALTELSEQVASTNAPHLCPFVLPYSGYLYAGGSCDNSVECYDPRADQWSLVTSVPGDVDSCCAAILERKLYVWRVWNDSNCLIVYDPSNNTWEENEPIWGPDPLFGMWSFMVRQRDRPMLLARGENGAVFTYDCETGKWTNLCSNPHPWYSNLTVIMM